MWTTDALAPVSRETISRVNRVAQAVADAGGVVDETARPDFDPTMAHDVYQTLLQSVMSSRLPDEAYAKLQAEEGLPIGVQVIGPQYGDLTTIGFARLLEQAGFVFTAPPGY